MTDYAQYQQPHHGHAPTHLQSYGGAPNPAAGNPSITSPTQQQMHPYQQTSPILPSQGYGPGGAPNQQHHQQMNYGQQQYMPGMPQPYGMSPSRLRLWLQLLLRGRQDTKNSSSQFPDSLRRILEPLLACLEDR
jgi:hypothetical protein